MSPLPKQRNARVRRWQRATWTCGFRRSSLLSHLIKALGARWARLSILILITSTLAASTGLAQTGGEGGLEGTVTDSTGAAIPNATVTATDQASNVSTTRSSTSAGLFSITPLIPGVYTITVKANGFSTLVQKNVEVNGLTVTGLNPQLKAGAVSEAVTVTCVWSDVQRCNQLCLGWHESETLHGEECSTVSARLSYTHQKLAP